WLYMNNAIDGNPQSIPVNGKFSAYPNATWGSRLKIDLPHDTLARLGIYQVTQTSRHGLNWDFYPTDGVMLLAQYGWNPEFCNPSQSKTSSSKNNSTATSSSKKNPPLKSSKNPDTPLTSKGLTGHYWMGGYYSTFEYAQFNSGFQAPNAYGLYWHADQTVYRPNPLADEGLVLWGVTTLCPQQNISLLPFQVNAGAVYTGLIPGRKDDFTIFGVMYGNFSTTYASIQQQNGNGNPTYELVYEFGYRINMTKFAYIQPDLQWVINPKGTGNIPNAVVLGAQMGVVF
ncbi:MAG TPA: carbohydrate porin, partial [Chthoniobacterales bacterium]|nr:carbohydrate porin [Chthoniobacterales bacterium]